MPQKKRLSDDAFSWVKKTEESKDSSLPVKKKTAAKSKMVKEPETPDTSEKVTIPVHSQGFSDRTVFVQYRNDGTIITVAGIAKTYLSDRCSPFVDTDTLKSAELKVPVEFETEPIIELHKACKVIINDGVPILVKKK